MKIRIIKTSDGMTELAVTQDTTKRPMKLSKEELAALISVLQVVQRSSIFSMDYEV